MPGTGFERSPASAKFSDPDVTAQGESRAHVALDRLQTLWFNTGSLCNIACKNCYIESSPRNDRLAYITCEEVCGYLDEIGHARLTVEEIGFTGGEPFLNREFPDILSETLARGYRVLVLTNAMKPMQRSAADLLELHARFGDALNLRVSIDHYRPEQHEAVRGCGTWAPMLSGLRWLSCHGFRIAAAGRMHCSEPEDQVRAGFAALFTGEQLPIDAHDPQSLVLFPEMDVARDVPEITTRCWGILGVSPQDMMCARSRMVIKRKGATHPVVVPCTLLPYDPQFELGRTLTRSRTEVSLNHPYCAQFCVLGGARCSNG